QSGLRQAPVFHRSWLGIVGLGVSYLTTLPKRDPLCAWIGVRVGLACAGTQLAGLLHLLPNGMRFFNAHPNHLLWEEFHNP
ncbi:MAG: hypothetical protein ACFFH0_05125, partial [Promethearchaeota archaeon]